MMSDIEEIAKLGDEILRSRIEPNLAAEDIGKYVAIAVDDREYEIDKNSEAAIRRLLARHPKARVWLGRAGFEGAVKMGLRSVKFTVPKIEI